MYEKLSNYLHSSLCKTLSVIDELLNVKNDKIEQLAALSYNKFGLTLSLNILALTIKQIIFLQLSRVLRSES